MLVVALLRFDTTAVVPLVLDIALLFPKGEALLVSARTLLAWRYTCYGCIAQPPPWTREVAWSTLLDLFLQEDYYLSVAEIMVPAIVLDFSLSVYRYNATAPDNGVMELLAQYTAV